MVGFRILQYIVVYYHIRRITVPQGALRNPDPQLSEILDVKRLGATRWWNPGLPAGRFGARHRQAVQNGPPSRVKVLNGFRAYSYWYHIYIIEVFPVKMVIIDATPICVPFFLFLVLRLRP